MMTPLSRVLLLPALLAVSVQQVAAPPAASVPVEQARADLRHYGDLLGAQSAFAPLARGADVGTLVESAAAALAGETVAVADLRDAVQRIQARVGGGAADSVAAPGEPPTGLHAPFLAYETAPGVFVALRPDRRGWLAAERPVLRTIDGVAVADWVAAAEALCGRRRLAVRMLSDVGRLRRLRELRDRVSVPHAANVTVEVASLGGSLQPAAVQLPCSSTRPSFGDGLAAWPRAALPAAGGGTRSFGASILDGTNVGYVRVPTMAPLPEPPGGSRSKLSAWVTALLGAMGSDGVARPPGVFATDGLVIDLRGNFGGGGLDIAQALLPYFLSKADQKHCQLIGSGRAALASRHLPADWGAAGYLQKPAARREMSDSEAAVKSFAADFVPKDLQGDSASGLVADRFTAMEFMPLPCDSFALSLQRAEEQSQEWWYHYANPVVVLQDADSAGTVEILLAAFEAAAARAPNIRLMGQTSGGMASALLNASTGEPTEKRFTLPNSKLEVKLAATAGFKPGGEPYAAAHGVEPHVAVALEPASLLDGQPDGMLSAALAEIGRMARASRGAKSCDRGPAPSAEDQTGQVCLRSYNQALEASEGGNCHRTVCTATCQQTVTDMMRTCANDTYIEVEHYYKRSSVVRGFNTRAVQAFTIFGPRDCDYSLLSAATECHAECTLSNLVNGTEPRWQQLRECVQFDPERRRVNWDRSSCASPQCEGLFQELLADCRACTQAGPELALESFLRLAAKDLVVCRAGVSGCDGVVSSAGRHSLQFIACLSF